MTEDQSVANAMPFQLPTHRQVTINNKTESYEMDKRWRNRIICVIANAPQAGMAACNQDTVEATCLCSGSALGLALGQEGSNCAIIILLLYSGN